MKKGISFYRVNILENMYKILCRTKSLIMRDEIGD